jgi:putative salt-induced outer membrane protein YdiY
MSLTIRTVGPRARPGALALALVLLAGAAAADECPPCPPPPPPGWRVSVGGGLSLTGGNTDTSSYNLTANVTHDPRRKNVFRGELLYLRASENDEATVERSLAALRDEYALGARVFVFGQLGYQRDRFKQLDYLIAPMVGAGIKAVDRPELLVSFDGSAGGAFERLEDRDGTADLALGASQRVEWRPAPTTTLFEKAGALWKTDDFGDAYYRFELGLAATLVQRLELKIAFADDYKTRPADPTLEKNDTSLIASLLYKF